MLESSRKPLKLIHFFNSPISMKVNWAGSLFSSRPYIHTVALIHTWELLKAQCSTVSHWAPSVEQLRFKSLGQECICYWEMGDSRFYTGIKPGLKSGHKLSLTTVVRYCLDLVGFWLVFAYCVLFMTRTGERRREQEEREEKIRSATDRWDTKTTQLTQFVTV